MKIDNEFNIGDIIYLSVGNSPLAGMITSIIIHPKNNLQYEVRWESGESDVHEEIELTQKLYS